ncbi:MAG: RICIN domain-containing protein [Dehalococcoidia bacterium]|nr:RICIN domain-containing protein [Dehalococcoidia bacterium]
MLPKPKAAVVGLILAAIVVWALLPSASRADHWSQGNIISNVSYWLVEGDVLRVCNESTRASSADIDRALAIWNDGVRSLAGRDIMVASCSDPAVKIKDGTCSHPRAGGCAEEPTTDSPQVRTMWLTPLAADPNNPDQLVTVIAHELGHNLGFCHADKKIPKTKCPPDLNIACPDSLMTSQLCVVSSLPQGDRDRYYHAYTPDPVDSLEGTPFQWVDVHLGWDAGPVHSEAFFSIWRWLGVHLPNGPKNASGVEVYSQPTGWQTYVVSPYTNALAYHYGEVRSTQPVEVGVAAPYGAGLVAWPGATDLRLRWYDDSNKEYKFETKLYKDGYVWHEVEAAAAPGRGGIQTVRWQNEPAGKYQGQVRACMHLYQEPLCSPWAYSGYVYIAPPSPPASVSVGGSSGNGSVSWSAVSGATYYEVFVDRWNGGSTVTLLNWAYDTGSPRSFSYSVSDSYHAAVRACNASGCSSDTHSNPYWVWLEAPPPSPPGWVSLSGGSTGSVIWGHVSGATYYDVFVDRWNGGSTVTLLNWAYDTASPSSFSYSVSDWYRPAVRACNANGCSSDTHSNPYWVWLEAPPSSPGWVSVSGSSGNGSVSWSAVSGATSYQVFVDRWNGGSTVTLLNWAYDAGSPSGFSYSVSDYYHAAVRACNASGCSSDTHSNWVWLEASFFGASLVAQHSGKCMDVQWGSTSVGAPIWQWPCNGTPAQTVDIADVGGGWYQIKFKHSGMCLDVPGASHDQGVQLWQYPCNGTDAQKFTVPSCCGCTAPINNKASGLCVDVYDASTADGAAVIQWGCHYGSNQQWKLTLPGCS